MDRIRNVKDLLVAWDLAQYVQVFEENDIDYGALSCIVQPENEDMLTKLVPVLGHAIRLRRRVRESQESSVLPQGKQSEATPRGSNSELSNGQIDVLNDPDNSDADNLSLNNSSVAGPSSNNCVTLRQAEATGPEPFRDSGEKEPARKRPRQSQNEECTNRVRELLSCTGTGRGLLAQSKSSLKLQCDSDQNKLSELIIDAIVTKDKSYKLHPADFQAVVGEILQLFPEEIGATYYIPYKVVNKVKYQAKGKLVMKYQSLRKFLKKSGEISSIEKTGETDSSNEDLGTEGIEEKLNYLRQNVDNWNEVTEYWTDTSEYRIRCLRTTPHLLAKTKTVRKGERRKGTENPPTLFLPLFGLWILL